jgi:hypothetical protein
LAVRADTGETLGRQERDDRSETPTPRSRESAVGARGQVQRPGAPGRTVRRCLGQPFGHV